MGDCLDTDAEYWSENDVDLRFLVGVRFSKSNNKSHPNIIRIQNPNNDFLSIDLDMNELFVSVLLSGLSVDQLLIFCF